MRDQGENSALPKREKRRTLRKKGRKKRTVDVYIFRGVTDFRGRNSKQSGKGLHEKEGNDTGRRLKGKTICPEKKRGGGGKNNLQTIRGDGLLQYNAVKRGWNIFLREEKKRKEEER